LSSLMLTTVATSTIDRMRVCKGGEKRKYYNIPWRDLLGGSGGAKPWIARILPNQLNISELLVLKNCPKNGDPLREAASARTSGNNSQIYPQILWINFPRRSMDSWRGRTRLYWFLRQGAALRPVRTPCFAIRQVLVLYC
jgi:hypothetical protein